MPLFPSTSFEHFFGSTCQSTVARNRCPYCKGAVFSGDFEQFFGGFTHEGSSFPRAVQGPRLQAVVIKTKSGNGEKSAREFIMAEIRLPILRSGLA